MMNDASNAHRIEPARTEDLPDVLALVDAADLPLAGIPDHFANFLVARRDGRIEGTVGLELNGDDAVLRSLAVAPGVRGGGVGRRLVESALLLARARGVRTVYLLTTTAANFFARLSFDRCDAARVPEAIARSVEFSGGICPTTSTCMCRSLVRQSCCGSRVVTDADDGVASTCATRGRVRARCYRSSFQNSLLVTDGF